MSRLLDANINKNDDLDTTLRPKSLKEYVGQEDLKKNLKIFIGAARNRDEPLDHLLFYGPPGLGKTTLAYVIANEMHAKIRIASGPSLEKTGHLAALLAEIEPGDILFIDEIHRTPKVVQEALYSSMEDFYFNVTINRDDGPKVISMKIPPFTVIGATTRAGDLSAPLRARFGFTEKMNFYTVNEINDIIQRTSRVLQTTITPEASLEIAKRSRGTPRIANRLFKRVRDFVNYENKNKIELADAKNALGALKVDAIGLDDVDINYLLTLINRFHGGPVGLETLANAIGEEIQNLEDVYEPYLLQIGFINRTPRGRVASDEAYRHLKIIHQGKLF